jgi:hypothetical protein
MMEGLGKLKKSHFSHLSRTRDLPAFSIMPQPLQPHNIWMKEGLGKLKKSHFSHLSRTRDLPAFSIVPQPLRYPVPVWK